MNILQYFKFEHLPPHLQAVSRPWCELAHHVAETLPDGAEKSVALRKLLEGKDAAVRASLSPKPAPRVVFDVRETAEGFRACLHADGMPVVLSSVCEKSDPAIGELFDTGAWKLAMALGCTPVEVAWDGGGPEPTGNSGEFELKAGDMIKWGSIDNLDAGMGMGPVLTTRTKVAPTVAVVFGADIPLQLISSINDISVRHIEGARFAVRDGK